MTLPVTVAVQARALYGFSRGNQALLSIAQPLVGALMATDRPDPGRLALAVLATAAAFLAVFAANDLFDARLDRRSAAMAQTRRGPDLDSAGGRHPLAQGRLRVAAGVAWVLVLGAVALGVAVALSPVCAALFGCAALLQAVYCRLATVTAYKCLLSGVMVAIGACAGWFAFADAVDPLRLGLLALWMAAWEIGGRNIPNDLADVDEDTPLGIRTVPIVHGPRTAARLAAALLAVAAAAACALAVAAWPSYGAVGLAAVALTAVPTALVPAARLLRRPDAATALGAFNRASFHPVGVLAAFTAGAVVFVT
ncbi:UbiA family prenyltransferase [Streptomyces sp. MAR4 CNX-425]|uniref:UbiA family prenyltransferase n=1 Tax=Streptomyces sp. MAR4 CNX-425 TaxID=3406343 RepID=UPI003B507972